MVPRVAILLLALDALALAAFTPEIGVFSAVNGRELGASGKAAPRKKPNVTVVVAWASEGDYAYGYFTDVLTNYWAQHLLDKYNTDPTWPFYARVELYDYQSNTTGVTQYLMERLNASSPMGQPPVSAVIAPEGNVGFVNAYIAEQVPFIFIPYPAICPFSLPNLHHRVIHNFFLPAVWDPVPPHQHQPVANNSGFAPDGRLHEFLHRVAVAVHLPCLDRQVRRSRGANDRHGGLQRRRRRRVQPLVVLRKVPQTRALSF